MKNLLFILLIPLTLEAKVLDKIIAVIDDSIYTLSDYQRFKSTLPAKKKVASGIYGDKNDTIESAIEDFYFSHIKRKKLQEIGYNVSDDSVESQILQIERANKTSRKDLITSLESEGLGFEEYFDSIKLTLENSLFYQKIVFPLISISEQELKNEFYRSNKSNNAITFIYKITDFVIAKASVNKNDYKKLPGILSQYRLSGILPEVYSKFESFDMGTVSEDTISPIVKRALNGVNEGEFSKATIIGDSIHVFYVQKKDLSESDLFKNNKDIIRQKLLKDKSTKVAKDWLKRSLNDYYTIKNIN